MTVTTHTYSATLLGTPDKPLSIKGGRVSLDVARFPHIDASLTVPVTDAAILADLDPRDPARIRIDAVATSGETPVYSAWTETRRNRVLNPRQVSTGAQNEEQPRYSWPRTWTTGISDHPLGLTTACRVTLSAASQTGAGRGFDWYANMDTTPVNNASWTAVPVTPGTVVTQRVWARSNRMLSFRIAMRFVNINTLSYTSALIPADALNTPANTWTSITATGTAPAGTTHVVFRGVSNRDTFAFVQNDWMEQTGLYVGFNDAGAYLDGSTDPSGTLSRTRWIGTADSSASVRETRTITGYTPNPLSSRSFDLSLRAARPNRATGDVELRLSSDEAVLQDFGPDADDSTPRDYESSVRDLTNYVLSKIGATLEPGTDDADVTARWSADNAVLNPDSVNGGAAFVGAGNATITMNSDAKGYLGSTNYVSVRSVNSNTSQSFVTVPQTVSTRKGQMWTFSAYMHKWSGVPSVNGILRVYEMDPSGAILRTIESTPKALLTDIYDRHSLTFTVENPNTAKLALYASFMATAAGQTMNADAFMLTEGPLLLDYFSGNVSTPGYVVSWSGQNAPVPHNSVSHRQPADGIERLPEVFTWRAGMGGVDFLSPILQSQGFRLVCDGDRKWTLRRDEYRTPGMLTLAYGVNIIGADEEVSRESEDWFDAAVYTYRWTTPDGTTRTEDDVYAPPGYTKMIRREIDRAYPGPGRARYAVQRALNKGRTLTVETVSDWTASTDQDLLVRLDGTPTQLGTTDRVEFDLNTDRMRVSSRTADVPEGAINLLPSTIDALTGSINDL